MTGQPQPITGAEVTEWIALEEMRGELRAQSTVRLDKQMRAQQQLPRRRT